MFIIKITQRKILSERVKLPQKIQTKITLHRCHYSINIPENKNIYQKFNIFICTTKLINNYNITCGSLTHRTRGYG